MDEEEFIKTLRETYKAKLPKKMHEIESEWEWLSKTWDNERFKNFHNAVHKFCGSSGSYGFLEVSVVVRELEVYVKAILHEKRPFSIQESAAIQNLVKKVKTTVDAIISEKNV